jgi:hypothetical protein
MIFPLIVLSIFTTFLTFITAMYMLNLYIRLQKGEGVKENSIGFFAVLMIAALLFNLFTFKFWEDREETLSMVKSNQVESIN